QQQQQQRQQQIQQQQQLQQSQQQNRFDKNSILSLYSSSHQNLVSSNPSNLTASQFSSGPSQNQFGQVSTQMQTNFNPGGNALSQLTSSNGIGSNGLGGQNTGSNTNLFNYTSSTP